MLACSCINADGEDHETNDRQHLNAGKPEFELAVEIDRQEVGGRDEDPEDGNENADRDALVPVLDNQASGCEFQCERHGPREPVDPAHGETKTGVDKASGIGSKSARNGDIRRHLPQGDHDRVHDRTDEDICNESTRRTCIGNCTSATDKETRSDGTALET